MRKSPIWFRRLLVGGVSTLTVGGLGFTGLLSTAGGASATSAFKITQLAGPDRFGTAAAIAAAAFPAGANTIIVASGLDTNLPDSLAASYLAAQQNGGTGAPILLVNADSVPPATAAAILSLKAKNIIIVGGTTAVTPSVATTLTNGGAITVTRVAGSNRFATADAIDSQTGFQAVGAKKTAIVADGVNLNLVDALGASPLAYSGPYPMFLVNGVTGTLSATDLSIMKADGITNAIIVGGTAAVGSQVGTQLTAAGITPVTEAGADRSATSAALAAYEIANYGFSNSQFNIAGGGQPNLVDSLSGGPLGGQEKAPTLITDSPTNGASVITFATANAATENSANLFGGTDAVSAATEAAIVAAAQSKPAAATSLPTLVSASILGTALFGNNTGAPVGTTVQYVFSQSMTGITPTPSSFHVYTAGDVEGNGGTAKVDATNSNAIDVLFTAAGVTDLTTTAGAATLTLATVSSRAVISATTGANPDGSEPIGTASTNGLTKGVTLAPDLVSASIGSTGAAPGFTALNVTFDKPAYVTDTGVTTGGFQVVKADGTGVLDCTPPGVGTTTASGGTIPGGNGTTTLTLTCTDETGTTPLTLANIARVTDVAGAVSTAATGGVPNPAEATSSPNTPVNANVAPDLTGVAVNLKVGASSLLDSITYTFSGPVSVVYPAGFLGINANGTTVSLTQDTASSTATTLVFTATDPAFANIVGASVAAGAVESTNNFAPNQFNELGVSNSTSSSVTPGVVAGPQLKTVALASFTGVGGTAQTEGTYTFSEPVSLTTVAAVADFHLYDANGTELNCTAGALTATGTQFNCTAYDVGAVAATATQLSSAVLGTVDGQAVTGTGNPDSTTNPEGAAAA